MRRHCGLLGRLLAGFRDGLVCASLWRNGDSRSRLAAKRVIVEKSVAGKRRQKQAKKDRQSLHWRERQPKTALAARSFPSKRSAQLVGRLCHQTPRINQIEDTTAARGNGRVEPGR
jgi:hypothetical protein